MTDWIEELNERSKDDKAIIVGSEVRALVAEIARLQGDLRNAEESARIAADAHRKEGDRARAAIAKVVPPSPPPEVERGKCGECDCNRKPSRPHTHGGPCGTGREGTK